MIQREIRRAGQRPHFSCSSPSTSALFFFLVRISTDRCKLFNGQRGRGAIIRRDAVDDGHRLCVAAFAYQIARALGEVEEEESGAPKEEGYPAEEEEEVAPAHVVGACAGLGGGGGGDGAGEVGD